MAEMEAPKERAARWMNDKDCEQQLTIAEVNKIDTGIELVFETPIKERIRRTTDSTKPEYAFLYNVLGASDWVGSKVIYKAGKQGRVPVDAQR